MIKNLITILCLLLLTVSSGYSATYYVSNSGDDGNVGSEVSPWASLYHVNTTIIDGDIVYFNRGDTWLVTQNRTDGEEVGNGLWIKLSNITIGAYGTGNKPIINAIAQTDRNDERGQNWYSPIEVGIRYGFAPENTVISDLDLRGPLDGGCIMAYNIGDGITVSRVDFSGAGWASEALFVAGSGFDDISTIDCTFDVDTTEYSKALEIRGGGGHLITGNIVNGYTNGGSFRISGDWGDDPGWEVSNNYFYGSTYSEGIEQAYGIWFRGATGNTSTGSPMCVISNNVFDLTESGPLYMWAINGSTLYDINPEVYVINNTCVGAGGSHTVFLNMNDPCLGHYFVDNNILYNLDLAYNNPADCLHVRNNVHYQVVGVYFGDNSGTPGTDANNVTTDPHLLDPTMDIGVTGAKLTALSTNAIDAGIGVPGVWPYPLLGYAGNTRVVPDIGAFEYDLSSTNPTVTLPSDYLTTSATTSFSGTADALTGTISNVVSDNGTVTIDSGAGTANVSFTVSNVSLSLGLNTVTVTATDSEANTGNSSVGITRTAVVSTISTNSATSAGCMIR